MNRENKLLDLASLYAGKTTLVAVAYFLFCLLGYLFISPDTQLPIIWPQAGLAIAAVLVVGFEALPGVFIGSFAASVATGISIELSALVALGNTLTAAFPAYFLLVKNNFSYMLDNISSILKLLLLGVVLSPMIAATVSLLGMYLVGMTVGEDFPMIWSSRWLRDALGVFVFAPFLIVWLGNQLPRFDRRILLEGTAIVLSGIALECLIFFGNLQPEIAATFTFFLIPIIIWASFRLKIHGLAVANLLILAFFLWGSAHNMGALFDNLIPVYPTFLIVLATMWATSLILSASLAKFARVQKSLSDLSNHDTLTGIYNRLFFETELKRLDSSRQFPISIIMTDLDNLKHVNDAFGHRAGDQLLKNLASLFNAIFRHEDIICRIGGDEFVILLPNTGEAETRIIMERLNKQVDSFNRDHPDLPIGISIGVSTASQGESLLGHLKIADNLMYEEKARKKSEEPIPVFIPSDQRAKSE
jgi:diguanylate cyclase (GGDEF)-like protein